MAYIIGIDGGGTKTKGLIADERGNVIAKAVVGPSNPNIVKEKELINTFEELFRALELENGDFRKNIVSLYAGISGAGNKENQALLHTVIKDFFSEETAIKVETDTLNALYSGTYGKPGIVQISGTGSITFGKNSKGTEGRVGGWGYLFGDEGSGYDLGRQAVIAALKAYDGRGADTILLSMLYEHFRVDDAQALIGKVYANEVPKNKISPLASIVFAAYKRNDAIAREIISQAVKKLAFNITALHSKLFPSGQKTDIVLCGGIFKEKEIMPALLKKELQDNTELQIVLPILSPAGGALIGAYQLKGKQVSVPIITNIINTQ